MFPPPHRQLHRHRIPHATLLTVDGMGHMLEPAFFATLTRALATHIDRSRD